MGTDANNGMIYLYMSFASMLLIFVFHFIHTVIDYQKNCQQYRQKIRDKRIK